MSKDKDGIVVLPPEDNNSKDNLSLYGEELNLENLLSGDPTDSLDDLTPLYNFVANPNTHIKDKINAMLRMTMFFSKEIIKGGEYSVEAVAVYRIRKEALRDLKDMIELLNDYSSVDTFDVEHPLFNKSLSFIIEALLTAVKTHCKASEFDSVVREVAIALPGIENRTKNLIQDSSTEEILALRANPIMDALTDEKDLFLEYVRERSDYLEYKKSLDSAKVD